MKIQDIQQNAFAMPFTNPAYPRGPYRFMDREFFTITYKTDKDILRAITPEPLEVTDCLVKYEFIRMPDSTGFGCYTESGQVIPVRFEGQEGGYVHAMYLNDLSPIAGGREIWGFPKKLAEPSVFVEKDTLIGTLDYGPVRIATGTMGYKHKALESDKVKKSLAEPAFLLKIIPDVRAEKAEICQLVRYFLEDVSLKEAWEGPGALTLCPHALAPVAQLPVREVISATHIRADLTLGLGEVVYDYLR